MKLIFVKLLLSCYKIFSNTNFFRKNCLEQKPLFLDLRRQSRVKLIAPAQKAYKIIKTVSVYDILQKGITHNPKLPLFAEIKL